MTIVDDLKARSRELSDKEIQRQNIQCVQSDFSMQQEIYWTAMFKLGGIFKRSGEPLETIKSIRSYPYVDSNIDILVSKKNWKKLSKSICDEGWNYPSKKDFIEQNLVEPFKLKYRDKKSDLSAAHFYGGVRWRYIKPLNVKRISSGDAWRKLPEQYRVYDKFDGFDNIIVPTNEFDAVIQAAHVSIENYRLTYGEVIHIYQTVNHPDFDMIKAERIASKLGLLGCFKRIVGFAENCYNSSQGGPVPKSPYNLSFYSVLLTHIEYGTRSGIFGFLRSMASLSWFPIMKFGRIMLKRN